MKYVIVSLLTLFLTSTTLSLNAADPEPRWAEDKLIYQGTVNADSWAPLNGYDDDAIDVDYFAGDTLRAAVCCFDSTMRVFRSNDNGQTWTQVSYVTFSQNPITEPYIVHGPDSTYHVFMRYLGDVSIGQIYTRAYKTSDDSYISGSAQWLETGTDTVNSYSVCTDRMKNHAYTVYCIYNEGTGGNASNMLTTTTDMGQNWTTPAQTNFPDVTYPDIACSGNDTLHLTYIYTSGNTSYLRARRSDNAGANWTAWQDLEIDTFPKMGPRIAAATNGSGEVWVIWSKYITDNWDLRWAWSQNAGAAYSAAATVNSDVDSNEALPNIALYETYGATSNTPYVSFVKGDASWSGELTIKSFAWSGSSFGSDTSYSDSAAFLTRPVQTFADVSDPAIAYVGQNAENVYFDSWSNSGGIKIDDDVSNDVECSLDRNIILGSSTLRYSIIEETNVEVSLINILGQKVAILENGVKSGGDHTVSVSAENLAQGIYYILIETGTGQQGVIKATVLK